MSLGALIPAAEAAVDCEGEWAINVIIEIVKISKKEISVEIQTQILYKFWGHFIFGSRVKF